MHIAFGEANPETAGMNKSAIQWDILKDIKKGGQICADGSLFYEEGSFLM